MTQSTLIMERRRNDLELWYAVCDIIGIDSTCGGKTLANRRDGLWQLVMDGGLPEVGPFLSFKYPATVGDTYSWPSGNTITVVATDTVIVVPAGTFECYHYGWAFPGAADAPYYDFFLAPGIGPIQTVEHSFATGRVIVWQLEKFTEAQP